MAQVGATMGSLTNFARNDSETVGTTSVLIAEAVERTGYTISNTSAGGQTITLNLGFNQAVANKGIPLAPGQAWVDSDGGGYLCHRGVITAISSAAGGTVAIMER